MKPVIMYAIVKKIKPKLSYDSLIRKEDKECVHIYKDEKIEKAVVLSYSDYEKLIK